MDEPLAHSSPPPLPATAPPPNTAALREFLSERDVPCPSCRYNLRGLRMDRCPECSQSLELGVLLSEPRLGAFITGVVGLAAGAGFSGLLIFYGIVRMMSSGSGMAPAGFFLLTIAGLAVEGGLLCVWVARGRRLRRLEAGWRWSLACGTWVLTALNFALFTVLIR